MITITDLKAMKCKLIKWNGGIMLEYYLGIRGEGRGIGDSRLSVWFGERDDTPFKTYLTLPSAKIYLEHVDNPERFRAFYNLMTGKVIP